MRGSWGVCSWECVWNWGIELSQVHETFVIDQVLTRLKKTAWGIKAVARCGMVQGSCFNLL